MAKHQITILENKSATAEVAPFLGHYVSLGDLKWTDLITSVNNKCYLTETMVEAIITYAYDFVINTEKDALSIIHLPGGITAYVALLGGFETADAAFDPNENAVVVAFKLDSEIANCLADITPTIVTDATSTKVKITNVSDEAIPKPYDIIHGCQPFEAAGWNLKMTDSGAKAYLLNVQTKVSKPCIWHKTVKDGQVEVFRSMEKLAGGDYKFVIESRGGQADGALQTVSKNIKYLSTGTAPWASSDKLMLVDDQTNVVFKSSKSGTSSTPESTITGSRLKLKGDGTIGIETMYIEIGEDTYDFNGTVSADGTTYTFKLACGALEREIGTYDATVFVQYWASGAETYERHSWPCKVEIIA